MATTFEKTWQHSWNYAPTTASAANQSKNVAWFFKAFLMGQLATYYNAAGVALGGAPTGLWTCYSSCDGAGGFGNGDSVDRWTSAFDATKIVQAAAASNHSWFVLKSPVGLGPVYVTIDMNSVTGTLFSVCWSFTAPSAGTATARPTATDEVQAANWSAATLSTGTVTQKCHGSLATDGNFSMFLTDLGGINHSAWIFQKLLETKTADTFPWAMYFRSVGAGGVLTQANLGAVANWGVRNFNGSAVLAQFNPTIPCITNTGGSVPTRQTLQDFTDGLYLDFPMYAFNNVAANYTLKGRFADIRWSPQNVPTGFSEPNPQSPTSLVLGHVWIPTYVVPLL